MLCPRQNTVRTLSVSRPASSAVTELQSYIVFVILGRKKSLCELWDSGDLITTQISELTSVQFMVCVYRYIIECMLRHWYGMVTSESGVGHTSHNKY